MSTLEKLALQGNPNFTTSSGLPFSEQLIHVRKQAIREILSDYMNIPHRMEHVLTLFGMDFINDAKAISINAVWYTLENISKPIVWILNEIEEKEHNNFGKIIPMIRNRVKTIILLNNKSSRASHFLADHVENIYRVENMEQAVELAYTIGVAGDTILFSPAGIHNNCYNGYDNEGERFRKAVKSL